MYPHDPGKKSFGIYKHASSQDSHDYRINMRVGISCLIVLVGLAVCQAGPRPVVPGVKNSDNVPYESPEDYGGSGPIEQRRVRLDEDEDFKRKLNPYWQNGISGCFESLFANPKER